MLGVAFLVALASLREFPIYLMDELDAALDPENQQACGWSVGGSACAT
jgi:chromosome segregation ATPase